MDPQNLKIFLAISIANFALIQGQVTTCGSTTTFTAANQVSKINWPDTQQSSCTYIFKAPADHYMVAKLSYNLAGTETACAQNQYVIVSRDNMLNWNSYNGKYCGYRSSTNALSIKSIGNELKVGIYSADFTRTVNVVVTVYPLSTGNCDCR